MPRPWSFNSAAIASFVPQVVMRRGFRLAVAATPDRATKSVRRPRWKSWAHNHAAARVDGPHDVTRQTLKLPTPQERARIHHRR